MYESLHGQWLVCLLHDKRQWHWNLVRHNKPVSHCHECRMTNSYFQCLQNEVCVFGMCSSGLQFDVDIKPMSLVLSHGSRVLPSVGDAQVVVSTTRSAIQACACYAHIADAVVVVST